MKLISQVRRCHPGRIFGLCCLGLSLLFGSGAAHFAQAESDNPHGDLALDCAVCHTASSWSVPMQIAGFGHTRTTGYSLTLGHSAIACRSCHTDLVFARASTDCRSCHDDIHAGDLGDQCSRCHTPDTWSGMDAAVSEHTNTDFPLQGTHATTPCSSCHLSALAGTFRDASTECSGCHLGVFFETTDPGHVRAGFSEDCTECHSPTAVAWEPVEFEHPTSFRLEEGHANVSCVDCHQTSFAGTSTECVQCHRPEFDGANPSHEGFPQDCTECHSLTTWEPADFDHDRSFPLRGAHREVGCADCHVTTYAGTPTDCIDCHLPEFDAADPGHDGFSTDCTDCHSLTAWEPATFEHPRSFSLELGHAGLDCAACHSVGYENTPTECVDCHLPDFQSADPNHVAGEFPEDCTACHSVASWRPASFEHPLSFPLTQGHLGVGCASCHASGYESTSGDCIDCHLPDSQGAEPNHAGFAEDCTACHSVASWRPASFEHPLSFPLTQGHTGVDCASCHASGYEGTSGDCIDCHRPDYQSADPNHVTAGFPEDCTTCHSLSAWQPASFEHTPGFPLAQGHADLLCASCHSGGYENTAAECIDCHRPDFQSAEPSHDGFPQDCRSCHNLADWIPADFAHPSSFPLTEGHGSLACLSCHASGYEDTPTDCISCHLPDFQSAEPNHDGFSVDCTTCHSRSEWVPAEFEHPSSFPLTLGHSGRDCASCHLGGYDSTPTDCVDCHLVDSQGADPNHDGLPSDCTSCHTTIGWMPTSFEHTAAFPLAEGHNDVSCASCHLGGYDSTPTDCVDCHLADSQVADPSHVGFPQDCTTCHTVSGWTPADFDHTGNFPLSGGHANVACASCHVGGYEDTATDCVDCHLADSQTAIPTHDGLPSDCTECHTITTWVPSSFAHPQAFPLTQGHDGVDCASCHLSGYDNAPTDCVDCHLGDSQGAEPSHAGFPQDCRVCHTVAGWSPADFDHSGSFPLAGGHANVACAACHVGGYEDISTDCVDCHLADSQNAEPTHTGLPSDCADCHTISAWIPSSFAHPQTFPLTQGHDDVDCASCHLSGYDNTPTDCVDCHLADSQGAEPSHAEFPQDCRVCHTVAGWSPADFDHSGSFPLAGGHANVACAACHIGGYENTSTDCVDCHLADSQAADPSHSGLPQDCTVCHTISAWVPSDFVHPFGFPLTGGHDGRACSDCHAGGYEGTPSECIECHLADFMGAEPDHVDGGFPEDCRACHTIEAWLPADFAHTIAFPLVQGHSGLQCADCHAGGYDNTSPECIDCHLSDFEMANPDHDGAGFPIDCTDCHSLAGWEPADFDHDGRWFPIYSGKHREAWNSCVDCHANPGDFTVFSCIDCHEHRRSETDGDHDEVGGYSYNSDACYSCHPRGDD